MSPAELTTEKEALTRTSIRRSLAACLLYGTTSVSITFFNKAVFAYYHFNFPCILTTLQISLCLLFLFFAGTFNLIKLPRLTFSTSVKILPLTLFWWLYVLTGIVALKSLHIPLFSTLRKLTALLVLILETLILHKPSPPSIWLSILIMVSGGILAGAQDLHHNLYGYLAVLVCCAATAGYLVLIVSTTKRTSLNTWGLLLYNNILSLPIMLLTVSLTNEPRLVTKFPHLVDPKFILFLLFSAAQATLLNLAIFWCTQVNSPLATTVTGQVKDVITVVAGCFAFGGMKVQGIRGVGLGVAIMGSAVWGGLKYQMVRARRQEGT